MTTGVRDPDARYDRIAQVLDFFFLQKIKALHTTIPGLVTAYDPLTKRANVQPALRMLLADGSEIEKPPILDVPLQQPAHGGHMVHQQVDVGGTYGRIDAYFKVLITRNKIVNSPFKFSFGKAGGIIFFFRASFVLTVDCYFSPTWFSVPNHNRELSRHFVFISSR